jgi:hypothetical protein
MAALHRRSLGRPGGRCRERNRGRIGAAVEAMFGPGYGVSTGTTGAPGAMRSPPRVQRDVHGIRLRSMRSM